jgi:hypothetical protein
MASFIFPKKLSEVDKFAKMLADENGGTLSDLGSQWQVKASPRIVVKRSTFDEAFSGRPIWDTDALWRGLILSRDGRLTKTADDEIVLEDV